MTASRRVVADVTDVSTQVRTAAAGLLPYYGREAEYGQFGTVEDPVVLGAAFPLGAGAKLL